MLAWHMYLSVFTFSGGQSFSTPMEYGHLASTRGCIFCHLLQCILSGMLLATGALMNDASAPILHLRNVNAYVSAALEDWRKNARLEARVPLQPGSGLLSCSCEPRSANALAGTSSFGMSGVNVHAIFAASEPASPTSQLQPSLYTRQRFWCIPSARLLLSGAQTLGSGMLIFSCDLRSQALSYLYDHQVCPVLGCTFYCCQCMLMAQF